MATIKAKDALKNNRSVFENELDDLISDAVHPDSFLSLDQHVLQEPPSKRLKTDDGAKDIRYAKQEDGLEHKSSRILRDRTNIPSPRAVHPDKDITKADGSPTARAIAKSARWRGPPSRSSSSNSSKSRKASGENLRGQRNSARENLSYEQLLDHRRREKLQRVDRYVPDYRSPRQSVSPAPTIAEVTSFSLSRLPQPVVKKIFGFALVNSDPITIDVSVHRSLVKEHTKIPLAMEKLRHDGSIYLLPMPWTELKRQIERMQEDVQHVGLRLNDGDTIDKQRSSRPVHHNLATALLTVSRDIGVMAAEVFYGQNVFLFPSSTTAWLQLDCFLDTIGPKNVARIQQIRVHVPLWHRGIHEDYIEGSLIDLLSPKLHLTTTKPSPHDRLLSSIQRATTTLAAHNSNFTLALSLENSIAADYWTGRYVNDKRLLSISDAEEHVERKRKGIACLRDLSELLVTETKRRPVLTLEPVLQCVQADKKEFRSRFTGLVDEAAKYGWDVASSLGSRTL